MTEIAHITLDTSVMREYAKYLKQAPQIVMEEMAASLNEAMFLLEREIKELIPVGAHGLLRGSVTHKLIALARGQSVSGKVFSPLNYAVPVELGTKPHFPPLAPLRDWVEKKLGVSKSQSRSVAFLVARKIAGKSPTGKPGGTKPQKPFETGFRDNADQVNAIFGRGLARIRDRLMGGKS